MLCARAHERPARRPHTHTHTHTHTHRVIHGRSDQACIKSFPYDTQLFLFHPFFTIYHQKLPPDSHMFRQQQLNLFFSFCFFASHPAVTPSKAPGSAPRLCFNKLIVWILFLMTLASITFIKSPLRGPLFVIGKSKRIWFSDKNPPDNWKILAGE